MAPVSPEPDPTVNVARQILACLDGRADATRCLPALCDRLVAESVDGLDPAVRAVLLSYEAEVAAVVLWCLFRLRAADREEVER